MKKLLVLPFSIFLLLSCETKTEDSSPKDKTENKDTTQVETEEMTEMMSEAAIEESEAPNLMLDQYISFLMPNEYGIYVEDKSQLEGKQLALYFNQNGLDFKEVELKTMPMKDNMHDGEGEMSLTQIKNKEDNSIPNMLLYGFYNFEGLTVPYYEGFKSQLLPGASMMLGEYVISADGDVVENEYGNSIENYKLKIEGYRNQEFVVQTFAEIDYFDDAMVTFIWAGDIDQDGIPDFLVDLSHKYSYSLPTLFLSSNAGFGQLIKDVAEEAVYGC